MTWLIETGYLTQVGRDEDTGKEDEQEVHVQVEVEEEAAAGPERTEWDLSVPSLHQQWHSSLYQQ